MGYLHFWTDKAILERAGDVELKTGIIDDVWVEPDFRKRGVASAILRKLVVLALQPLQQVCRMPRNSGYELVSCNQAVANCQRKIE